MNKFHSTFHILAELRVSPKSDIVYLKFFYNNLSLFSWNPTPTLDRVVVTIIRKFQGVTMFMSAEKPANVFVHLII